MTLKSKSKVCGMYKKSTNEAEMRTNDPKRAKVSLWKAKKEHMGAMMCTNDSKK